ncbi:unnamed protein product [Clonostachys rosea]|uniref:F-box domain-containing protein n=1 Tax=Bionectria ochroleuca TaxID=29856 RepID=A0ABY6U124_BIOOC|nr:unnamed protein product [Clonostachys rosea]
MSVVPGTANVSGSATFRVPTEVWEQVFHEFHDNNYTSSGQIDWRGYAYRHRDHVPGALATLQSLRLTCRLFNRIASPLLCTFLRLELSQASLDRLTGLSKNALIIKGLRGLQLSLAYRPTELARDIASYMRNKLETLNFQFVPHCEIETESLSRSSTTQDNDLRGFRLFKCLDEYEALSSAWENYIQGQDPHPCPQDLEPHQRVLRQSFESYKSLHEEQFDLLMSGSFVNTIASTTAKTQHPIALSIHDHIFWYSDDNDFSDEDYSTELILNREKLSRFLLQPHSWEEIEIMVGEPMILPIRILVDLPIAIHEAGGCLDSLSLDCFSSAWRNVPMDYSHGSYSESPWSQLKAACQQLRVFEFGSWIMNEQGSTRHNVKAEDKFYVDKYVSVMLASPNLKCATIDMACLKLEENYYCLQTYLSQNSSSSLQKLALEYVHLSQRDLEALCRMLGPKPVLVQISVTTLLDGSWSGALEMLRSQVRPSSRSRECKVSFFHLAGGEFGVVPEFDFGTDDDDDDDDNDDNDESQVEVPGEYDKMISRAEQYVLGSSDSVSYSQES